MRTLASVDEECGQRCRRSAVPAMALLCVTVLVAASARGASISDTFTRVSSGESLVVPFTSPSVSTAEAYGGSVEVIVSGTGNSYGARINDAFYGISGVPVDYQDGSLFDTPYYQLNIGWQHGFPLAGCDGEPHNISNFITFIDGTGPTTPPAMPAYDPLLHTYHFVVQVAPRAGPLTFGVSDCVFDDNGGQYTIQVFQLGPLGVPTPTVPPTPPAGSCCIGDCDGNGAVTIEELIRAVDIGLGKLQPEACINLTTCLAPSCREVCIPAMFAISNALSGCTYVAQ